MKKHLLFTILLAVAFLQVKAQLRIAPEIGADLNSMRISPQIPYETVAPNFLPGGRIGGRLDVDLNANVYFQTGLFFSIKGDKNTSSTSYHDTALKSNETLVLRYIEMPIDVVYKARTYGYNRFFIGAGAYLARCISANDKGDNTFYSDGKAYAHNSYNSNLRIGSSEDLNSFDIGINATAGYEWINGFFVRANLDYGFNTVSNNIYISERNWGFGVSAGYYIHKHVKKTTNSAPSESQ